ncbi:DUF4382 domain-containing protein, partial [Candidatus Bathyarchaeota archaeon]|nr:DUF4382 domain-containing protein [Candidatus Bathyarchaeota archaeon]
MAISNKRSRLFALSGVVVAIAIIAAFVSAGTIFPVLDPSADRPELGKPMLTVLVTDKPVELKELWITIDLAQIQDQDGNLVDLPLELSERFDLLELQDGLSETLTSTELDPGSYTKINLHIAEATAIVVGEEDSEDTEIPLRVPSGVLKVQLKPHLSLVEGESATVVIDLQPENPKSVHVSRSLNLRPVIKAIVETPQETASQLPAEPVNDLAITGVTPTPVAVEEETTEPIEIEVEVENLGTVDNSDVLVAVTYDEDQPIDTETISELESGETQTLTFLWDVSNLEVGEHTITATIVENDDAIPANDTNQEPVEITQKTEPS